MTTRHITIALTVTTESEQEAATISEQLSRQALGFALAGHDTSIEVGTFEYTPEIEPS